MTIKCLGIVVGANTAPHFCVLAFDRVTGVYPKDMADAMWESGFYARVLEVSDDVVYLEVEDCLTLEVIQEAFKAYGL